MHTHTHTSLIAPPLRSDRDRSGKTSLSKMCSVVISSQLWIILIQLAWWLAIGVDRPVHHHETSKSDESIEGALHSTNLLFIMFDDLRFV